MDNQPGAPADPGVPLPTPEPSQPNTKIKSLKKRRFHIWPGRWSTKQKRLATGGLLAIIVLLAAGGYYWYHHVYRSQPVTEVKLKAQEAPKPTTVASPLTGVQVAPALAQRPVTAVMIENSIDARPQAGLKEAGVVFEAVAEGGITRFMALFQEAQPDYIGPIRSSRPYFLDWLLPFDAAYAHVGGSPEALALIKSLHVKDMDQFAHSATYTRVSTRYAPHNVYTSMTKFDQLEAKLGYTTSKFTSFARKPEAKASTPTITSIDLTMSGYLYNVHYDYAVATNSYNRGEGGKPHLDDKSGQQLSPKVVIALVMHHSLEADDHHNSYATIGSGAMYVFQDGGLTTGTWKKSSPSAQFIFTDQNGQELKLDPGQTWITMVDNTSAVGYK